MLNTIIHIYMHTYIYIGIYIGKFHYTTYIYIGMYIGKFHYTPMITSLIQFETLVWRLMKGLAGNLL